MIWLWLTGILAVAIYYMFVKPLGFWKAMGVKQTNPVVFFGDNWKIMLRIEPFTDMLRRIYNLYPESRYTGFYQFNIPTLMIKDRELMKQLGVKEFDHFTDHRSFIDPEADPLWGKNLFALRGQPWREMRATLSGSFTSSKMRHMFDLLMDASENFTKYFLNKDEKVIEVEMKNIFTRFTNDVIATTAFGIKVDSLEHENNEFYLMGKEATDFTSFRKNIKIFGFLLWPSVFKHFKITLFSKPVRTFFTTLIKDTIKTREEKGIVRPDMINLLLEARKGNSKQEEHGVIDTGFAVVQESEIGTSVKSQKNFTDDDIVSQALIFFFAGFDTVSNLMCFMAYELAVNQDIQKKLREEIKITATECKGKITYETLLKMKYLDMVVSEALRKWPPVIAVDRVCTKPFTIDPVASDEQPINLKLGDTIWFPIFAMHRDPEIYPEPEKFDPERFSDENKDVINPYSYCPFGIGPRNCIGSRFALLETKAVFFNILSNFEIVPTARSRIPVKISKNSFNMVAEGGFWFGLKRV